MLLAIIKLALYAALCYSFARICLSNCGLKEDDSSAPSYFLQELVLNTLVGISSHLLIGHLIALIIGSFIKASLISLILMLLTSLIFGIKQGKNLISKPQAFDIAALTLALIMSVLLKMRYELFGDAARFHLALTGSIANNHNYPPIWSTTSDLTMSFYHYGMDLFTANIKLISGLSTLDTFPMHIGFVAIFGIAACFVLMRFFIKSEISSFFAALFFLLVSISGIEYFFTHIGDFGSLSFLQDWSQHRDFFGAAGLEQSRGAVANWLSYSLIVLVISQIQKIFSNQVINKFSLAAIFILSFMLQTVKSTLWASLLAAMAICLLVLGLTKLIQKEAFRDYAIGAFVLIFTFYIAKILAFGEDLAAGFHGIKPMIFQPSWNWVMQGLGTLPDYFSQEYLQKTIGSVPDLTHGTQRPTAPLLSMITFRKYGFYALFAAVIFLYQVWKKKLNWSSFLLLIAWVSAPVPFLMVFVPKPFEILRMLGYLAIYSIIFIFINLTLLIKDSPRSKLLVPVLCVVLVFFSIPCVLAILPSRKFTKGGGSKYWLPDAKVIAELERIHKTGDILVDSEYLHLGHHASELAGFYGVGGQMYKSKVRTRWTVLNLMNPLLLEELDVDYVLVGPNTFVSEQGKARLQNPKFFQEIKSVRAANPSYQLYKFVGGSWAASLPETKRQKLNSEYHWVLGYTIGEVKFQPHNVDGKLYAASREDALKKVMEDLRAKILPQNRSIAIYTVTEALPQSSRP